MLFRSASGALGVDAYAKFELGFGFDLNDVFNPKFYVHDDTGVTFGLTIKNTEPLSFKGEISLGGGVGLGLSVKNGSAQLTALAHLGLKRDPSDGQYLVSELGSNVLDFTVAGSAAIDLPMYFPIASLPMGGTTKDRNGNGYPDNVLHVGTGFSNHGGFKGLQIITPNLVPGFDLFAYLNDPATILSGLEKFFTTVQDGVDGEIGGVEIPVIGDAMDDAANFVGDLRDRLLGEKVGGTYTSGLGQSLQQGSEQGKTTIQLIQEAMFDSWGDYLKIETLGSDGRPVYKPVTRAEDIELV